MNTTIPNHLIHQSSPYLLQHAYNPVEWYPWGKEALAKAIAEDKPILVSIGYSACHWCHVMERECFEKDAIATLMNTHFINIKIDREERPDLDQLYLDAVQAMGIQGGWPLNVFLTPETKPFYGGTYFPPEKWSSILSQIANAFKEHRPELEKSAEEFCTTISRSEVAKYNLTDTIGEFNIEDLATMYSRLKPTFDRSMGGTNRAPKFPMPSLYSFLLRYASLSKNEEALLHVTNTLDKMAFGGIYDQLGGGFARYSTDMDWFAPHFEKMLYDNGQLISLYSEAYQLTKKPLYKTIVYETIAWLEREMISAEGGFFSALDADSEGIEGKFYCWEFAEIKQLLGNDSELFNAYYNLEAEGNWEHGMNILVKKIDDISFASQHQLTEVELNQKITTWKTILLEERAKRIRPGLDDKILASWNGLILKGLSDAYRVFDEDKFLQLANRNANFLTVNMRFSTKLFHTYKNGKASVEGYLEDYTFVIEGYIALYEATFEERWLNEAIALTNYVIEEFYDENEGLFFFTSNASEKLIARKKELFDNVIPASNSSMAKNLHKLGLLLYKDDWRKTAESMLFRVKKMLLTDTSYLSNWACLFADCAMKPYEIAFVGKNYLTMRKALDHYFIPNKVVAGTLTSSTFPLLENKTADEGKTLAYICYAKTCLAPVETVEEILEALSYKKLPN